MGSELHRRCALPITFQDLQISRQAEAHVWKLHDSHLSLEVQPMLLSWQHPHGLESACPLFYFMDMGLPKEPFPTLMFPSLNTDNSCSISRHNMSLQLQLACSLQPMLGQHAGPSGLASARCGEWNAGKCPFGEEVTGRLAAWNSALAPPSPHLSFSPFKIRETCECPPDGVRSPRACVVASPWWW